MTAARIDRASNFTLQRTMGSRCSPLAAERGVRQIQTPSRACRHRILVVGRSGLRSPGVLAHGEAQEATLARVQALALRVIAERSEHGEAGPELLTISFNAA